jgi:DNA polymerase-3 subunit alpha
VPEEKELQQVLHNIRPGEQQTLEEQVRNWGYNSNLCPPWNDNAVIRKLVATGISREDAISALLASEEIAQRCAGVEIPSLDMVRFPVPHGYSDALHVWRDWLQKGWEYRGLDKLPPAQRREYRERLKHEMTVIEGKDFIDYFLIVSDAIRWAKDHDIGVGPARGSAAGSLACWLLRITEVNPMLYPDLVFERFIDVTREDLPDIDVDFNHLRRSEVRDYLVNKYGRECVNNMGTFSTFKAKQALDDVARVFRVPKWKVEKVKDVLIERSSGDLRASATIEDTVVQFPAAAEVFQEYPDLAVATDLEGNLKSFGVHAAGLVISTGPIDDVCAVYTRKTKDEIVKVVSLDKYDAEIKGLLKLDFLGLVTMTMLDECRKEMGWSLDQLYNLDLDDQVTTEAFKRNDVTGIFQIEGRACRYVCGALQPDSFKEVCDVTALARPGPLHNGAANAYIDIKMGRAEPEVIHPALASILASTRYQIVYQEQILRILGEIGGFDWTHRAEVRRIISRKIGEQEFNRRWGMFRDGALSLHGEEGMTEPIAKDIWGRCITAGSYAFNASHTVAYGMLSWHSQWFKQHEPELWFQQKLRFTDDKDYTQSLIRDTHRFGRAIEVRPPDVRKSMAQWTREAGALRAGFQQIDGIGDKMGPKIIEWREDNPGELLTWSDLKKIKGIGPKTTAKFEEFAKKDDPFGATWLDRAIAEVKRAIDDGELGAIPHPTHVAADLPYASGQDIPIIWLGVIHTRNERDLFEFNQAKGGELDMTDPKRPLLDGKPIKDPHLSKWVVMVGDDESDQIGLRVDRWKYPRLKDKVWKIRPGQDLVLVRGVKPGWMPTRQITVGEMWIIDPEI